MFIGYNRIVERHDVVERPVYSNDAIIPSTSKSDDALLQFALLAFWILDTHVLVGECFEASDYKAKVFSAFDSSLD